MARGEAIKEIPVKIDDDSIWNGDMYLGHLGETLPRTDWIFGARPSNLLDLCGFKIISIEEHGE